MEGGEPEERKGKGWPVYFGYPVKIFNVDGDLVACTGDYVHEDMAASQIDTVWPLLARLKANFGVHSVLGNHDHWADTQRSQEWLHRTNQDLRHKVKVIEKGGEKLWIAGAGDLWEDHKPLDHLLSAIPDSECRVVLAHNPDTADSEFSKRVDLMISGHTHGGQVNIPFIGPPVLPVRNKGYSSGLKTSPRGTPVFISKGIGWAVYPVRLNCPPEIAVLELVPAKPEGSEQRVARDVSNPLRRHLLEARQSPMGDVLLRCVRRD